MKVAIILLFNVEACLQGRIIPLRRPQAYLDLAPPYPLFILFWEAGAPS